MQNNYTPQKPLGQQNPTLAGQNPYLQGVFFHADGTVSYDPHGNAPLQGSVLQSANQWNQQNGQAQAINYGTITGNNNNNATNNYYNDYAPLQTQAQVVQPAPVQPAPYRPIETRTAVTGNFSPWAAAAAGMTNPMGGYTGASFSPYAAQTATNAALGQYKPGQLITNRQEAMQVMGAQKTEALRQFDQTYGTGYGSGSNVDPALVANMRRSLESQWDQSMSTTNASQFFQGHVYYPVGGGYTSPSQQLNTSMSVSGSIIPSAPSQTGWGTDASPMGTAYGGAMGVQQFGGAGGYSGISSTSDAAVRRYDPYGNLTAVHPTY